MEGAGEVVQILSVMVKGIEMPFKLIGGISSKTMEIFQAFSKHWMHAQERRELRLTKDVKGETNKYNLATKSNGQMEILNVPEEFLEKKNGKRSIIDEYANKNGLLYSKLEDLNLDDTKKQILIDKSELNLWNVIMQKAEDQFRQEKETQINELKSKSEEYAKMAQEQRLNEKFAIAKEPEKAEKYKSAREAYEKESKRYMDMVNNLSGEKVSSLSSLEEYYLNSEGGPSNIETNLTEIDEGIVQHESKDLFESLLDTNKDTVKNGQVDYIIDPTNPELQIKRTCSKTYDEDLKKEITGFDFEISKKERELNGSINEETLGFVKVDDAIIQKNNLEEFKEKFFENEKIKESGLTEQTKVISTSNEEELIRRQEIFTEKKRDVKAQQMSPSSVETIDVLEEMKANDLMQKEKKVRLNQDNFLYAQDDLLAYGIKYQDGNVIGVLLPRKNIAANGEELTFFGNKDDTFQSFSWCVKDDTWKIKDGIKFDIESLDKTKALERITDTVKKQTKEAAAKIKEVAIKL